MLQEIKNHKHIVFGFEHYNPLGIIRSLGEYGIRPIAILIQDQRQIASKSKYISKLHMVNSIEEGYRLLLSQYGSEMLKPFVYTSDDQITHLLDEHYNELKDLFFFNNAGQAGRLDYYMNKYNVCELAKKHGIPLAKTWTVKRGEIPEDLTYPIITKAIISTLDDWKRDSFICHSEQELREAYSVIRSPQVLLQQYIEKKNELCLDGYCVARGTETVITIASTYEYVIPESYSYYMTVKSLEDQDLYDKIRAMFQEVKFEGIFSLEFLVGQNDELYFLEINFRNSTWSYASTCVGMSLPVLWAEGLLTGKIDSEEISEIREPFKAMVEFDDFRYRVKQKKMSFIQWWKEYRACKCKYYYVPTDKAPFFSVITAKIKRSLP